MLLFLLTSLLAAAALAARLLAPRLPALPGAHALPGVIALLKEGCVSVAPPPPGWLHAVRTLSLGSVKVRLPAALGGDDLFSCGAVAAAWPAWRTLAVTVASPAVNATLHPPTLTPHVMRLAMHVGLASCAADPATEAVRAARAAGAADDADAADGVDPAAVAAVAAAAAEGDAVLAALPRQLSLEPRAVELRGATLSFSLLHLASLHVTLAPGTVALPSFLADVLGDHVSLTVAGGAAAVGAGAAALHTDAGAWTTAPPPSPVGRPLAPLAMRAETAHGGVTASGWWTDAGVTLRAPAAAALDFTPALVTGVLGHVHPLLAGAVRLEEDDAVRVSLEPAGMHVPTRAVTLNVAPMRLQVAPNPLILGSLKLASRFNKGTAGKVAAAPPGAAAAAPTPPPSAPRRATSANSADGAGRLARTGSGGGGSGKGKKGTPPDKLEAWTSPIRATLHADALAVDSGRLDMLVSTNFSAGQGAVHLAMWGTASIAAAAAAPPPRSLSRRESDDAPASSLAGGLAMTLALMSDSLGLPGDPLTGDPSPAVRVPVTGPADAPRIGWGAATGDTLTLLAETATSAPGLRTLGRWLSGKRAAREAKRPALPPPAGDLPWQSRLQRSGGSRRDEEAGAAKGPAVVGRLQKGVGKRSGGRSSGLSGRHRGSGLGRAEVTVGGSGRR